MENPSEVASTSEIRSSMESESFDEGEDESFEGEVKVAVQLPLISWTLIENEFNARFSKILTDRNSKAHFDFLGEMVDGAKERWRSVQLLDALLCAVYNRPPPLTSRVNRRVFGHHDVFRHSVIKAMEAAYDDAYGLRSGHVHQSGNSIKGESCGILCDIRSPWTNFETLKIFFLSQSAENHRAIVGERAASNESKRRKGFLKRKHIIDALSCAEVFLTHTLPEILVRATERILHRVAQDADLVKAEALACDPRLASSKSFIVVAPAPHMREFLNEEEPASSSTYYGTVASSGVGGDAVGSRMADTKISAGEVAIEPPSVPMGNAAIFLPPGIRMDKKALLKLRAAVTAPEKSRESGRQKRKISSDVYDYGEGLGPSQWRHLARKRKTDQGFDPNPTASEYMGRTAPTFLAEAQTQGQIQVQVEWLQGGHVQDYGQGEDSLHYHEPETELEALIRENEQLRREIQEKQALLDRL